MKLLKKILFLILLVALATMSLSCKKDEAVEEVPPREYVESEVIECAKALINTAKDINRIVWGVGILPVPEEEETGGVYRACASDELARYGVSSVDDIRTLCQNVYSEAMCKTIENTAFSNVKDDGESIVSLVRYYDKTDKDTETVTLMVNTNAYIYFEKEVLYHTDTLKVTGVRGEVLTLTVSVTVYDGEDKPHEKTLTFQMIEESDGWRLHSPTYMKYDPYADIYDDLTK